MNSDEKLAALQQTPEFQEELKRIETYTETVCQKLNWDRNQDPEITGVVKLGLARNKIVYGFQACPCYGPLSYHKRDAQGETMLNPKGEPLKNMKVNCPCEPARMLDVPGTITFASREEMEKKTEGWPDRGTLQENPDGSMTLSSHHPGFCHCFLFKSKEA